MCGGVLPSALPPWLQVVNPFRLLSLVLSVSLEPPETPDTAEHPVQEAGVAADNAEAANEPRRGKASPRDVTGRGWDCDFWSRTGECSANPGRDTYPWAPPYF